MPKNYFFKKGDILKIDKKNIRKSHFKNMGFFYNPL
jgi:hypothetical protein